MATDGWGPSLPDRGRVDARTLTAVFSNRIAVLGVAEHGDMPHHYDPGTTVLGIVAPTVQSAVEFETRKSAARPEKTDGQSRAATASSVVLARSRRHSYEASTIRMRVRRSSAYIYARSVLG